jgi:hypothetical protein
VIIGLAFRPLRARQTLLCLSAERSSDSDSAATSPQGGFGVRVMRYYTSRSRAGLGGGLVGRGRRGGGGVVGWRGGGGWGLGVGRVASASWFFQRVRRFGIAGAPRFPSRRLAASVSQTPQPSDSYRAQRICRMPFIPASPSARHTGWEGGLARGTDQFQMSHCGASCRREDGGKQAERELEGASHPSTKRRKWKERRRAGRACNA